MTNGDSIALARGNEGAGSLRPPWEQGESPLSRKRLSACPELGQRAGWAGHLRSHGKPAH